MFYVLHALMGNTGGDMTTNTLVYTTDSNGVIHFQSIPEGVNLSTDIAGIIVIKGGAEARSTVLNDNFTYLNAKVEQTNNNLATTQSNVQSTINTTLSIYQDVVSPKSSFDTDATDVTSGNCYIKANSTVAFTPTGDVTFVLPTITDNTKYYQILVQVNIGEGATSYVTTDDARLGTENYFNDIEPVFSKEGMYDIYYEYDNSGSKWVCGSIYKGTVS